MTEYTNDVVAIREAFESEEGRNRTLKISDEILDLAVTNNKDWDNLDEEQTLTFLETVEAAAAKVSVSDPGISNLIKKMDKPFHDEVAACIEAVVKGKTTAVDIYAQMRRIYTKDEMDSFPIPGTEKEHVTGNQRPDKVKTTDQTGKAITVVWTNDFVSAMPEGKAFETTLDDVAKELKAPGSIPHLKTKEGKNPSKKDLADIKAAATQGRNALRSMVKRSIALHHQLEAIAGMPLVGLSWQRAKTDKFITIPEAFGTGDMGKRPTKATRGPKPFWMFPADDPSDGNDFSVTQLLALDVPAAIAAGGTMANLVATAARGSTDEPGSDEGGDGADMSEEVAMATFSQLVNYLNKRENRANVLRILADKKHPEHKDWVENVGDAYALIYPIMKKIKTEYETIKETTLDDNEQQAAA